ncbi:alpha/beta fold hydrolase [Aurantivibrio infirmus]
MNALDPLKPSFLLRNPDVQNILSSTGIRKLLLKRRMKAFLDHTSDHLINSGVEDQGVVNKFIGSESKIDTSTTRQSFSQNQDVQLSGELTFDRANQQGLVILIHGWEGSSQSAYVLSAAMALFTAGYNVFRLNLRDHGDSQRLNQGLFNSTLIDEVNGAIKSIQQQWPHSDNYLAGFSLGGNFALRVALSARRNQLRFNKVVAVCPVIDPAKTLTALENANFFYQKYFVSKWRNSLLKKLRHFPGYAYGDELKKLRSLADMHDFFVPRFTPFDNRNEYFEAYQITPEQLGSLKLSTTIINSLDDPITCADFLPQSQSSKNLSFSITEFGSHCAFLKDLRMNSWADEALVSIFQNP